MATKVRNMTGRTGRKVANQFIISDCFIEYKTRTGEIMRSQKGNMFQSYQSNIAFKSVNGHTFLDAEKWDFSVTTGKYRNIFLNETKKETLKKIKSGEYILTDLN